MDKEIVVYIELNILFTLKKEGNPVIWDSMDEPVGHYAKLNKAVTEGQILHDSTSWLWYSPYMCGI